MIDLISRQAAIDAIRASTSKFTGFMEMEMYTDDDAVEAINGVPSAEPVRHGKWIWKGEEGDSRWMCSACLWRECVPTCNGVPNIWNYCPSCGARMDAE